MIEHRLIERMIRLIGRALVRVESEGGIDPVLVDTAVDFIRTYADRTHHGKEEDILFRELEGKGLSIVDRQVMNELIQEHAFGRSTTASIVDANTRYRGGDESALADITAGLAVLVEFYPKHIEKEDKVFFPASRAYFTEGEDRAMLAGFREFDSRMIHEKYEAVVRDLGG